MHFRRLSTPIKWLIGVVIAGVCCAVLFYLLTCFQVSTYYAPEDDAKSGGALK